MFSVEEFREYCLKKQGVEECFPFDETTLVFKVMGKMFALTDLGEHFYINLKCEPQWAIELREKYSCISAGFHMNKKHWNTVKIEDSLPISLIYKMIDHSYDLIVKHLTLSQKEKLKNLD